MMCTCRPADTVQRCPSGAAMTCTWFKAATAVLCSLSNCQP